MKLYVFVLLIFAPLAAIADDCGSMISNFHPVSPGIYRGARPENDAAITCLKNIGVQKVIDLQGGDYSDWDWIGPKPWWITYLVPWWEKGETPAEIDAEKKMVEAANMEFISRPLDSMNTIKSNLGVAGVTQSEEEKRINDVLATMNQAAIEGKPVFVHCAHGNDRTGLIVALYRVLYENVAPQTAYQEMHDLGHSYTNMIMTWPMDLYFFEVVARRMSGNHF